MHDGRQRHGPRLRRHAALAVRGVVLLAFAAFFVVPLAWLVLAPTKTDTELLTSNPLAFGSIHNVWDAWRRVDGFDSTSSGAGWRIRSSTR